MANRGNCDGRGLLMSLSLSLSQTRRNPKIASILGTPGSGLHASGWVGLTTATEYKWGGEIGGRYAERSWGHSWNPISGASCLQVSNASQHSSPKRTTVCGGERRWKRGFMEPSATESIASAQANPRTLFGCQKRERR